MTIDADYPAREAVKQLEDEDLLQRVTLVDIQAKSAGLITNVIHRDMRYREFLDMYEAQGGGRWILSPAKVPQDLQTDQTMRHLRASGCCCLAS